MITPTFETYRDKYDHIALDREGGVLEVRLHTDGGEVRWNLDVHEELSHLVTDIGRDDANKVIILTGTGDSFIAKADPPSTPKVTPQAWARMQNEGIRLLTGLLDIEAPMIAAINGPARIHAELALLCDVTLAAEHTVFQDRPHLAWGLVPGDGTQVIWPLLLGFNRGRYFIQTSQEITADEALRLGVVNEVTPREDLLPRARELAEVMLSRPELARRFTRTVMLHSLKKTLLDNLGYGLALEGLSAVSSSHER